ncbi:hypothetical protein CYMTET_7264 [Cymbomonas tetramitiformis]|uniref:Uncharacterized protein n=1 Tax=Cymbomonas tetramitiformis TaxID=36881 RepID=A0AAE0GVC2_9CHLO|nr:hypothetical protein CYMTET_7264 [Cymbomonas tetramitiformis]
MPSKKDRNECFGANDPNNLCVFCAKSDFKNPNCRDTHISRCKLNPKNGGKDGQTGKARVSSRGVRATRPKVELKKVVVHKPQHPSLTNEGFDSLAPCYEISGNDCRQAGKKTASLNLLTHSATATSAADAEASPGEQRLDEGKAESKAKPATLARGEAKDTSRVMVAPKGRDVGSAVSAATGEDGFRAPPNLVHTQHMASAEKIPPRNRKRENNQGLAERASSGSGMRRGHASATAGVRKDCRSPAVGITQGHASGGGNAEVGRKRERASVLEDHGNGGVSTEVGAEIAKVVTNAGGVRARRNAECSNGEKRTRVEEMRGGTAVPGERLNGGASAPAGTTSGKTVTAGDRHSGGADARVGEMGGRTWSGKYTGWETSKEDVTLGDAQWRGRCMRWRDGWEDGNAGGAAQWRGRCTGWGDEREDGSAAGAADWRAT